jgi:phage N-6-adenine-methyltransferase
MAAHVSNNSGNNEWYTPRKYLDAACTVLGGIDFDPASSEVANRMVQAWRFYTAEENGLARPWPRTGSIWMNPPYSQPLIRQFAEKFAQHMGAHPKMEGIVLVNNATETAWFQVLAERCTAICFPKGRIRFVDPDGNPGGAPLQGQAFLYFGGNMGGFSDVFSEFGFVMVRP